MNGGDVPPLSRASRLSRLSKLGSRSKKSKSKSPRPSDILPRDHQKTSSNVPKSDVTSNHQGNGELLLGPSEPEPSNDISSPVKEPDHADAQTNGNGDFDLQHESKPDFPEPLQEEEEEEEEESYDLNPPPPKKASV